MEKFDILFSPLQLLSMLNLQHLNTSYDAIKKFYKRYFNISRDWHFGIALSYLVIYLAISKISEAEILN